MIILFEVSLFIQKTSIIMTFKFTCSISLMKSIQEEKREASVSGTDSWTRQRMGSSFFEFSEQFYYEYITFEVCHRWMSIEIFMDSSSEYSKHNIFFHIKYNYMDTYIILFYYFIYFFSLLQLTQILSSTFKKDMGI